MRKLVLPLLVAVAAAAVIVPPAVSASSRSVTVRDFRFAPGSITVRRGTAIVWHFRGPSLHNVTAYRGPRRFHSPDRARGTFRAVLTRRGTYRIMCTIHPFMKMTVRVR